MWSPDVHAHAPVVLQVARLRRYPRRGAAVESFQLDLREGEIVALLGDTDSGASTLLQVLAGADAADSGEIRVTAEAGRSGPIRTGSRRAALRAGIVPIDLRSLAPDRSGLDNILLGSQSYWRPWRDRRAARRRLIERQQQFDLAVDLEVKVANLSTGERLRIALLRALRRRPRVLLLDEPGAGLSAQEAAHLFAVLRKLSERGMAVLLTTRRPDDAIACADRIAVIRSGNKVADLYAHDRDAASLASLMTDWRLDRLVVKPAAPGQEVLQLLKVDAAVEGDRAPLRGVSLDVREREIVGIAAGPGNGQAALMALFSGLAIPTAGTLRFYGRTPRHLDPALLVRVGVARIPADCRADGIVPAMSVLENFLLEDVHTRDLNRRGLLARANVREIGQRLLDQSGIESARLGERADRLSDADMRRLVLTRVFESRPCLIIADHPTRDLDLVSRREVHLRLIEERDRGAGILVISDDLEEVMALSDYIGVLREGRLTIPQPAGVFDRHALGVMMGGHGSLAQDWSEWGNGT